MCLDIGTPKNINFSFETNGKLIALGVPILKHFRVLTIISDLCMPFKVSKCAVLFTNDSYVYL